MNTFVSIILVISIFVDIICEFLLVKKIKKEKEELQNKVIELEKIINSKKGE